jgi:hypothetical protein
MNSLSVYDWISFVIEEMETFVENLKILNQIDEINKIQGQITKIEDIRLLKKRQRHKFYRVNFVHSIFVHTVNHGSVRNRRLYPKFLVLVLVFGFMGFYWISQNPKLKLG